MQSKKSQPALAKAGPVADRSTKIRKILIVGEVAHWRSLKQRSPLGNSVSFVDFQEVSGDFLGQERPDFVLSPLFCPGFDCFDLALVLHRAGFAGSYRAIGAQLPDPGLIRREIAAACPGLDFDIVSLTRSDGELLN